MTTYELFVTGLNKIFNRIIQKYKDCNNMDDILSELLSFIVNYKYLELEMECYSTEYEFLISFKQHIQQVRKAFERDIDQMKLVIKLMFEKIEVTKKYEQDMMNNKKLKRKYEAEVDKNSKLEAAVVALQREKLVLESNLRTQTARVKSLGVENDQLIDAHKELEKKLILVEADNIRQIEGSIELDFNIGNTLIPVYEVLKNECGNGKILQSLTKLIGESKVEGFLMKKFGQHCVSDKNQVLISSKLLINDILHNTIRYFYYKIGLGLQIAQDYDDIQKNKGKYFKFIITGLKLNLKNTLSSIFSKHYSSEMADALSNLLDATLDFLFLTNIFYSQIQMKFSNGNLQYNKENMILKKDFCGKEEKKKYISVCPALIDANTQKYLEKEIVISYI